MITTTHARTHLQSPGHFGSHLHAVLCPCCAHTLGIAHTTRERMRLLTAHCCEMTAKETQQPAAPLPFH